MGAARCFTRLAEHILMRITKPLLIPVGLALSVNSGHEWWPEAGLFLVSLTLSCYSSTVSSTLFSSPPASVWASVSEPYSVVVTGQWSLGYSCTEHSDWSLVTASTSHSTLNQPLSITLSFVMFLFSVLFLLYFCFAIFH